MKDLRELRNERGLTLTEAAEEIGISKSALGLYEMGKRKPKDKVLNQIADFYGVEAFELTFGSRMSTESGDLEESRLCPFKIKRQKDVRTGNVTEWFLPCAGKKCMAFGSGGVCGRLK